MAEFPDLASKLSAPSKKSQFERQKAESDAKRAREKAETAAALAEFEKSFDDDEARFQSHQGHRGPPAPGKRHFPNTNLRSGPGTLPKSGPGSLGPAFNKKRPFDDYTERRDGARAFQADYTRRNEHEQDEEKAAKPTLHMASMPPSSSPAFIKGLFAHTPLNIEHVRILDASGSGVPSTGRRSCSAIVTLAAETPATDIDTVVSQLQNKYLGFGFNLSISRHLSSAALNPATITAAATVAAPLPFGARPIPQATSLSRAPPPGQRFAPPQSYTSSSPYSRAPSTQVVVQSPSDLKQLKLIHKTLEALLTYGPEFEALLMSRPEIQRDEKWAWLWNSASVGGVYYRWRLWSILTRSDEKRKQQGSRHNIIFDGQAAWHAPEQSLRFEYTTHLDDLISDEDYNSSDEEDDDDGRRADLARRYNDHNATATVTVDDTANDGMGYLDPLAKAKLTHLLSRLPDSSSKLRRGDIARITAFAIEHAGAGGDEVAALVTRNVVKPFATSEDPDTTSASMVGLYAISDILSCSASAGVRHAWRYRTLFEQALRQQRVFERLGRADKTHKWGKLKGEKWKRSVQNLLSLWEGWSVFPQTTQEEFTKVFDSPPLTEDEKRAAEEADMQKKPDDDDTKGKLVNRWKTVDEDADADTKMEDLDGVPMDDDDEIGEVNLENIDGISMVDSSDEEEAPDNARQIDSGAQSVITNSVADEQKMEVPNPIAQPSQPPGRRQRPRASDLFAG